MASGLPVVAFNYAAAAEMIVSGVNGRLAAMRDAEDFVFAASQVAAQPVQLKSMAAAARQTALGLDWACIVEKFENELQEVIDASRLITHSGTPPRSSPLNASRV
jgi:glycosyltransferase involved in cell wall biosynthesis